jgi:hypothetical protein
MSDTLSEKGVIIGNYLIMTHHTRQHFSLIQNIHDFALTLKIHEDRGQESI